MSESLIMLTKNERMSELLVFLSESLMRSFFSLKTSDSLGNPMSEFPTLMFGHVCHTQGHFKFFKFFKFKKMEGT